MKLCFYQSDPDGIFKKNDIKKFFKNNLINYHPSRLSFIYSGGSRRFAGAFTLSALETELDISARLIGSETSICGAVLMYKVHSFYS